MDASGILSPEFFVFFPPVLMYLRGVKLVCTVSLLQNMQDTNSEATTPLLVESSVSYSTCESKLLARMYQPTVIQREYKSRVESNYVGLPQLQFSFNTRL